MEFFDGDSFSRIVTIETRGQKKNLAMVASQKKNRQARIIPK